MLVWSDTGPIYSTCFWSVASNRSGGGSCFARRVSGGSSRTMASPARTCRPPPWRRDAPCATAAPVTGQRYAAAGHTGPDLPVLVAAHSCVHAAVTSGDEAPAAKLHRQRGRSLVLSARPRVGSARTSSRQPPAATRKAYGSPDPCCALTLAGVKLYWQLSCRTRRVSKKSPRSTPLHAPRHRSPQLLPWTLSSSTRSAATTAL